MKAKRHKRALKDKHEKQKYPHIEPEEFVGLGAFCAKRFECALSGNRAARLGMTRDEVRQIILITQLEAACAHKKKGKANLTTFANCCLDNRLKTLLKRTSIDKYTKIIYVSQTIDSQVDELDPETRAIAVEDFESYIRANST